jgi:hypothetical protein
LFSTFLALVRIAFAPAAASLRADPLQQVSFGISNGAAKFDVRRAIAPHARLGKPGSAQFQKLGSFLWRPQSRDRHLWRL